MYKKLRNLGILTKGISTIEYDGVNTTNKKEMNSTLNYLIEDRSFEVKQVYETEEEYNFRMSYYNFVIKNNKIKGDIAKVITYMQINKIKLNTIYDPNYEKILSKLEQSYLSDERTR